MRDTPVHEVYDGWFGEEITFYPNHLLCSQSVEPGGAKTLNPTVSIIRCSGYQKLFCSLVTLIPDIPGYLYLIVIPEGFKLWTEAEMWCSTMSEMFV